MPELLPRPAYLEAFRSRLNTPFIKVLTGLRRCGKSCLLSLLASTLLEEGVPSRNVLHRRLDELSDPLVLSADDLARELLSFLESADPGYPRYVFLDEVQQVEGWERVVRGLEARDDVDVWITGSNASMLSGDLATLLAGRYTHIRIYPLSFAEYVSFSRATDAEGADLGVDELFARYRRFGGMPGLFALRSFDVANAREYLVSVLESVILHDVAARNHVRDIDALEKVVQYVFATSGSLCSTRNIAQALRGAADVGLRNLSINFGPRDLGFQLEDIVAMELLRRGCELHVGSGRGGEVDFVVSSPEGRSTFVQVTEDLADTSTFERELAPLRAQRNAFAKVVLSATGIREGVTEDGIQILSIIPWLLGRQDWS